ncbi:MAG: hypothetical protein ACR2IN_02875 [Thermoleophilaceae bacterium]
MPPTRILLTDMPPFQREIVTELLRGVADVEVVSSDVSPESAGREAARTRAKVVIAGRDDPHFVRALLEALPRMVVLTLAGRELTAWRHGLSPYRERLGELSPAALTAGIRARGPQPSWWTD